MKVDQQHNNLYHYSTLWESIPGTNIRKGYEELCEGLLYVAKQYIACGHHKNYCMCHVGTKRQDPLSTLFLSPNGGWLQQSCFDPTFMSEPQEARAVRSCQFHQFLALQPQGVEHQQ